MKSLHVLILSTLILNAGFAQTIRRVNNNAGVTGLNVYATAQAAQNAAAANDILYIEPSNTSYGTLTVTKPLKIYGNGYFLDTNTELKADTRSSTLSAVNFDTGSDGSSIFGITGNIGIYGVSNISIQRCNTNIDLYSANLSNTTNSNLTNISISNNIGFVEVATTFSAGYTISNALVTNNILNYLTTPGSLIAQSWVVSDNTFTGTNTITLSNSTFENNLLVTGQPISFNSVDDNYNVSSTNSFTDGTGNQNNYSIGSDLLGTGTGISLDESYQINSGSILKTAGNGGIEVGAFGSTNPYIISGIPAIPSIVNFTSTGTGSNTTPLQVTISIKSNN